LATARAPIVPPGAGAVLDHELLAERLTHVLSEESRQDVVAAAGRERHHDGNRAARIDLRCGRIGGACMRCNEANDECRRGSRKSRSHGIFQIGLLARLRIFRFGAP
jgi:hypothetical protein